MACALTQGYVNDCRDSRGGSREFYIAEFSAVAPTIVSGVVTAILKTTGKQFYKYEQIKQTSEADEALNVNEENGTVFAKQTVKLALNRRQATVRSEITLLAKNKLVIIEVDQNGDAWYYGAKNGMLMESSSAKSGKAMGDRNGYELTFGGHEPELAYSVNPALITALTTPGV